MATNAELTEWIANLNEAISEGVLRVNIDGVVVTYNTTSEMLKARDRYQNDLRRQTSGRNRVSTINQRTGF